MGEALKQTTQISANLNYYSHTDPTNSGISWAQRFNFSEADLNWHCCELCALHTVHPSGGCCWRCCCCCAAIVLAVSGRSIRILVINVAHNTGQLIAISRLGQHDYWPPPFEPPRRAKPLCGGCLDVHPSIHPSAWPSVEPVSR